MNIKPLYKSDRVILVGLDDDFSEPCVLDGLVSAVDLDNKKILQSPRSGQKILREGNFTPILSHQKDLYRKKIKKSLKKRVIANIERQLKDPSKEAVDSLIWKPERLLGNSFGG